MALYQVDVLFQALHFVFETLFSLLFRYCVYNDAEQLVFVVDLIPAFFQA